MKKTEALRRGLTRSIVWTAALLVLAPLFAQEAEYSDGGRELRRCPRDVKSFTIPSTVLEIGDHAFAGCSLLESVTIPDSVREIEDEAFRGCISLASITIPASVREIEDDAFWGCSSLDSIEVDSGNRAYRSIDGALYSRNKKVLRCCPGKRTSFVIPSSVTIIGDSAFGGCGSLESVTIPDSVREIEDEAFRDCVSLAGITIPDSVREIEDEAFRDCSSLVRVEIPDSVR
ncbi:MAG: leucine-rich repeat domain-containing protein, partial [Thermoguttaceae bacterium]|nr:leucine-rich repeat domain-containing protein [Thermoguttaceae bacterium]